MSSINMYNLAVREALKRPEGTYFCHGRNIGGLYYPPELSTNCAQHRFGQGDSVPSTDILYSRLTTTKSQREGPGVGYNLLPQRQESIGEIVHNEEVYPSGKPVVVPELQQQINYMQINNPGNNPLIADLSYVIDVKRRLEEIKNIESSLLLPAEVGQFSGIAPTNHIPAEIPQEKLLDQQREKEPPLPNSYEVEAPFPTSFGGTMFGNPFSSSISGGGGGSFF